MGLLWSLLFVDPLIVVSTVAHATGGFAVSLFDPKGRVQVRLARSWARSLLRITGARISVEGLEHIRADGSYIFVANHLSYMDTPAVLSTLPVQFRFLAKSGLFQIPFLGWHLRSAGHIPVPLEDPRASVRTLAQAGEVIRKRGISLLVFPEGGRSMDGELQDFKDGAAYMALKAQVPLVPIALIGTRELLPMGSATFRSGPVRIRIGAPIPTEGLGPPARKELTRTVRARIASMLGA